MVTAIGAFIGALFAGPIGLPVGGAVGGLVAMKTGSNFKSLSEIVLNDLNEVQQENLKMRLVGVVRQINAMDALQLITLFQTDKALMGLVIKEAITFVHAAAIAQPITS